MGSTSEKLDYDVLVVGAGISGINVAYRLQQQTPERTYAIIEARQAIGGTWDLFKYPGIRSDSDLHTFGFPWRPWPSSETIADAHKIRAYVQESAEMYGIDKKIKFGHRMSAASWSTPAKHWTIDVEHDGQVSKVTASFLVFASGYYDYHNPLPVKIPGLNKFEGQVLHPQFWPEDLDYTGKKIVIIGSGATAITLLPNLVDKAAHVTMLQRSPTYIMSLPRTDPTGEMLKAFLPSSWAYQLIRLKFLILPFLFFQFCRAFPKAARWLIRLAARKQLPKGYPLDPDFSPRYGPWEQRLCVCPDGDFYKVLGTGKASVVTAHIDTITEKTIVLKDGGETLRPDIIVTATGLKVQLVGGAKLTVDGQVIDIASKHVWKGALMQDVPNAAFVIGYTNASWTLGADATSQLVTRILNSMKKAGQSYLVPHIEKGTKMDSTPFLNLNSTYITEAGGALPRAGDTAPWLPRTTYLADVRDARYGSITDDVIYG